MQEPQPILEYDIYLPSPNTEHEQNLLRETKTSLTDFFGGLTITNFESQGRWRIGPQVVKDKIQIWRVISDRGEPGDVFLKELRSTLERSLNQQKILIVKRRIEEL